MAPYQLSVDEVGYGFVLGHLRPSASFGIGSSPRAAIERIVQEALEHPPCVVAFSGGRDSSAVLAVAVAVARRVGLPLPIPVTLVYPGFVEADEQQWRERVLAHVGMSGDCVDGVEARDVLGNVGLSILKRYGPVWPAMLHGLIPLLELAAGGSLLTGEGGDEVLGAQRITPLVGSVQRRLRPTPRVMRACALTVAPRAVRARSLRALPDLSPSWLLPEADRSCRCLIVDDLTASPLRWDRAVRAQPRSRSHVLGFGSMSWLAGTYDVQLRQPFTEPRFVDAFAAAGGRWGFVSRREALEYLVGDLLPGPVLSRTSKAFFNGPTFGPQTREFIGCWTGDGLPEGFADPEALWKEWSSEQPSGGSIPLLQHAWCAANGAPLPSSGQQ